MRTFSLNRGKKKGKMFISLFDSQYYLNVIGQPQNTNSQIFFGYNHQKIKTASPSSQKEIPTKLKLEHMEQKVDQKPRIHQQVKCIQKARVLKYDRKDK